MTQFLPLQQQLARLPKPIRVFFRDDDGGWSNEALISLLAWFDNESLPMDLAVIPDAVTNDLRQRLERLSTRVHQHGFRHHNHQREGRQAEFGSSRCFDQQFADMCKGKQIMEKNFGDHLDPIFTPPWNRCTATTLEALTACGLPFLSRDAGAQRLALATGQQSIDVQIDWQKSKSPRNKPDFCFQTYVEGSFQEASTVGVMLHHAIMDEADFTRLREFVSALRASNNVEFIYMHEVPVHHFLIGATL